ncbi:hypothetical protein [Streptomyces avermitilis]|uniref:hypothetical protein n=1 Tax=Streptomyces avermitilis TaxID=33903 RepID=UPI0038088421
MTRMKKYLVAACAVTVMGGVPTGAYALASPASTTTHAVKAAGSSVKKGSVQVVAPSEKITVAPGVKMWLTQDGKQCVQHSFETTPWCQTLAGGKSGANWQAWTPTTTVHGCPAAMSARVFPRAPECARSAGPPGPPW